MVARGDIEVLVERRDLQRLRISTDACAPRLRARARDY
jgi:hypothetical protein